MAIYAGIDLGTTNSAICTFDGENVRVWKSPEQNDVTPSVIYNDGRRKYVGKRAYDLGPNDPFNVARLFKRLMGTSTKVSLKALPEAMTPELCSAEVLRTLFGYVPEELRGDIVGTVITVPAAFNQMQKDATLQAAELAGIGSVTLMQEPVAAVMAVMRSRSSDGMFVIYDLGGGTLDVAIAESLGGRVNLLAHGGIEMCGGRDWDRVLFDSIVRGWLEREFNLPEDLRTNEKYRRLVALGEWAVEKAKIELAAYGEAQISLAEAEVRLQDLSGKDIYLEIALTKSDVDRLIEPKIMDSVAAVQETLSKAMLSPHDIERIVFVGGPTQYKTVRERVAAELAISGAMDVNPMTAVAEGAAVFAESIDWSSQRRSRKGSRASVGGDAGVDLSFNFTSRTPEARARLVAKLGSAQSHAVEFQVDSADTGWSTGRISLSNGAAIDLALQRMGENTFKVSLFDSAGRQVPFASDTLVIVRTSATVDSIPASSSIGVETLERIGGNSRLHWLIRAGDPLPRSGTVIFRAAESIKAGSKNALMFKLFEGDIESPPTDNRFIGCLRISGLDFDTGAIPQGAPLECSYEISDSGNIRFEISIESIQGAFNSGFNFYAREDAKKDFSHAAPWILEEANALDARVRALEDAVPENELGAVRDKVNQALSIDPGESDPETAKQAHDCIGEARKMLAKIRENHKPTMRKRDLESITEFFEDSCKGTATPSEVSQFENLSRSAKRAIDVVRRGDFETCLDEMRTICWRALWRQDAFVLNRFKWMAGAPHLFADRAEHQKLVAAGVQAVNSGDMKALRDVVGELEARRVGGGSEADLLGAANILVG